MGITNFPNGASSAGTVTQVGTTSITGAGTVTTTLDSIAGVVCSIGGLPGTASGVAAFAAGTAHVTATGASTFILRTLQSNATTAGTIATPVSWVAYGAKA